MKKGFTIVELMAVIAIIGVLMGIVTTAASSSIKMSRNRKASALCTIVQAGLATYHAQMNKWPISSPETTGTESTTDVNIRIFSATDVQKSVKELVDQYHEGNPVMDVSGLFVSRQQGEAGTGAAYGLDFWPAINGTKQSPRKMTTSEMFFGYPESEHGWFRRFKMVYSIPSDSITVSKQDNDSK